MFNFILILLVGIAVYVGLTFNRLQGLAQQVRMEHANTVTSMKKQLALINRLQDVASAYDDGNIARISVQEASLDTLSSSIKGAEVVLSRVVDIARQRPELRSNESYQSLMRQIEALDLDLQNKRERYNQAVKIYNADRSKVPIVFFSKAIGFHKAPYFDQEASDISAHLRDFASEDGEQLKEAALSTGRFMVDTTKQVAGVIGEASRRFAESRQARLEEGKDSKDSQA